jgi:tRNA dimethylallyltransferase
LYIDAVLYDFGFPREADAEKRERLAAMADDELQELLLAEDPEAFAKIDVANRRRVIRALETVGQARTRQQAVRPQTLVLGLGLDKKVIQERITKRIRIMLGKGFLEEVRTIGERYGWNSEAMTGIGYRAFRDVVLGTKTAEQGVADFVRGDMMLVKKQLTWFKRNQSVRWLEDAAEAEALTQDFLKS